MSGELRYVRAPVPVHFPEHEQVPESKRHFRLRTLLYEVLALAFADRATIGSDSVHVLGTRPTPKRCLAPDAFVRLGEADHLFRSWKVWERGAPHLAIEIISDGDDRDSDWEAKIQALPARRGARADPFRFGSRRAIANLANLGRRGGVI